MTKFLANVEEEYYEEFRIMGYIDGLEDAEYQLDPEIDNDTGWAEYATGYAEGHVRRLRNERAEVRVGSEEA